jgi:multiple sugar transport system ATP-binding protein
LTGAGKQPESLQQPGAHITGVVLEQIVVKAGEQTILDDISLSVGKGELMAVIGPSGSGKTTLLRVIAGLDNPSSGTVTVDGDDMTTIAPRERNVAMVFQDAVLYPFMTAKRNVALPLKIRNVPETEISERVHAEGRALDIDHILERWPRELSAGHQQLVQVARAMVRAPSVFLLDEPLARVDAGTRLRLRSDLRRIQRGYEVTTLYVTNDPVEAMAIADRIAVIDKGRLIQVGQAMEVYDRPTNRFVAELIGDRSMNFLSATVRSDSEGAWLAGSGFEVRVWARSVVSRVGSEVVIGVRPEGIVVDPAGMAVETLRSVSLGSHSEVQIQLGSETLWMRAEPGIQPTHVRLEKWHVFDGAGNALAHIE